MKFWLTIIGLAWISGFCAALSVLWYCEGDWSYTLASAGASIASLGLCKMLIAERRFA